ncbi:hypothetical protein T12_1599 [Trichinella patagoniensis]|uniref:Uncharacterized protein n=1 Tax=Trichinella patagoniensis TaxID=990121 RepID=A0A0V1A6J0_9BILA|nr:hypothetical protein T12_1599 [Trichinella patagoniensis]
MKTQSNESAHLPPRLRRCPASTLASLAPPRPSVQGGGLRQRHARGFRATCRFTRCTLTTLSFTRMSSTYAEVPLLTSGSWESTQFSTVFITNDAMFKPNPIRVRHYRLSLKTTVW